MLHIDKVKNPFLQEIISKVSKSDIGNRMAKGAFWTFTGTVIAKLLVLIGGIVCANILGKEKYGEFGLVRSTINMFIIIGAAELGLTATKYISEYKNTDKKKVSSIYLLTNAFSYVMGVIITVLVLLLAPYIATHTIHAPYLVNEIRVGAVLLFVAVVNNAQNGTLSGFEDFKSIAINTFYSSIAEVALMLVGAWYAGVFGAVLGYGMGFAVLYLTNALSIRRDLRRNGIEVRFSHIQRSDVSVIYKFSLPAALCSVMVAPVFWVVRTLLVNHSGFGELGLFEAADQWKVIVLFIPTAVSQILLPIMSNTLSEKRYASYKKSLYVTILLNVIITLVISLGILLFSSYIMRMYGKNFTDTRPLIVLAFSTIFTSVASVVGISIASQGKMWVGFVFNVVWATLFIGISYVLIQRNMGALGIAWGLLISYFLHTVFQSVYFLFQMHRIERSADVADTTQK